MPTSALALALAAAFVHALWNLILARERDPQAATVVALVAPVLVFAPLAALAWDVDPRVWPFIAVTSLLQLSYFALLATAYRRADMSFVYPVARSLAPVVVLAVATVAVTQKPTGIQAAGVLRRNRGSADASPVARRSSGTARSRSLWPDASRRTRSSTSTASPTRRRSSTSSSA